MTRLAALLLALAPAAAPADLPIEQAQVVATYPHDITAFTEGLFFRGGWLYESTGYEGQSFIRKEELDTGTVVASVAIPPHLFGEGIVDWKDKLYSLTWRGGQGFKWTIDGFRKIGGFHYAGEGWALTRDNRRLIMSDGTAVLRFLNPVTLKVIGTLPVTADGKPVGRLNELEYVKGEILANIWQTNAIARIDPATGKVKGWIDVAALSQRVGANGDAVPNGIAYDRVGDRLFVTGKDWPLLFEIKPPQAK